MDGKPLTGRRYESLILNPVKFTDESVELRDDRAATIETAGRDPRDRATCDPKFAAVRGVDQADEIDSILRSSHVVARRRGRAPSLR